MQLSKRHKDFSVIFKYKFDPSVDGFFICIFYNEGRKSKRMLEIWIDLNKNEFEIVTYKPCSFKDRHTYLPNTSFVRSATDKFYWELEKPVGLKAYLFLIQVYSMLQHRLAK